jgi:hypothetical protein
MSTAAYVPPFTVEQVAAMLGCTDRVVRDRAGELGGLKFGRDYVFPAGALFRRLDEIALERKTAPDRPTPAPSGVLVDLSATTSGAGKGRRKPPALPALADSAQPGG